MMMLKTRLILKPGQKGAKRLTEKYGDLLLCVRFRYDDVRQKRLKTVELIEEETNWVPPSPRFALEKLVPLQVSASNMELRVKVKAAGGKWIPEERLWYVRYGSIAGGPLENYIHIDDLKSCLKK
jgi:hypothetical protein